jgi:adenine-specific DNA-methyltransferase
MAYDCATRTLEKVESALGTPAYRGERCLIYQGDCVKLMGALPQTLGDLTITSPPYNIGKEYENPRPVAECLDWCESWIQLVHRFTRREGA